MKFKYSKILVLLVCMSSACIQTVHAQVGEARNDFSIGFNGGYSMAKMDFNPAIKQSYKGSPTFGFSARYICEKYFTTICGVLMEVNYANVGWKELIEDGSGNTYSCDLTYIQVPILMQLGWGYERRGCKFLFEAGPQIGYNLGKTPHQGGTAWDVTNRPNNVVEQYDIDVKHKIDYGITAGFGIELSTAIGHFLLDGRYYFGLGDAFDNSSKAPFSRSAHQVITGKLTYLFDIVKTKKTANN